MIDDVQWFVGIDWATQSHRVCLLDIEGRHVDERDFAHGGAGLNASDHCVFLPRLAPDRFAAAIGQCDIVLDSIGWSGCNSILESLIHNVPIVAFAGKMMRGRHATAILKMMNVRDTTARTVEEYVLIASILGRNETRRKDVSSEIAANKHRVYHDLQCIAGLEAFLEEAVRIPQA